MAQIPRTFQELKTLSGNKHNLKVEVLFLLSVPAPQMGLVASRSSNQRQDFHSWHLATVPLKSDLYCATFETVYHEIMQKVLGVSFLKF